MDDEVAVLLALKAILERLHFTMETFQSAAEAAGKLSAGVYEIVITDGAIRMKTRITK
jgi:DNA-binding NtrC family response regulator